MSHPQILVADTRHFGRRRFPPLYDFAAKNGVRIREEKSRAAWWERTDGYRVFADRLGPLRRSLEALSLAELKALRHRDVRVFACAEDAMLRLSFGRPGGPAFESNTETIAQSLVTPELREELLLCMATALDWIEFWHRLFDRDGPFLGAVADRGRAIHSRSLLEVASRRGIRTFVTGRFAVGRHFFFEEWTTRSGADWARVCGPDWFRRLVLPSDLAERERVRAEAHRRLAPIRAAVAARPATEDLTLAFERPAGDIALVLAGSDDDPSLLDPPLATAASPGVCRRVVAGILDHTDFAVAFRADAPLARFLELWREKLPANQRARLQVAGSTPLEILLPQARLVVSLSAALTIEACRAGMKPVQFGHTALHGGGFTHDFAGTDEFLAALATAPIDGFLSLDEYRGFEDFLARLVLLRLLPEGEEGVRKIASRLADPGHVSRLCECDFGVTPPASAWVTLANAAANPTAARRLAATWSDPD
jgi:hypothetical protein